MGSDFSIYEKKQAKESPESKERRRQAYEKYKPQEDKLLADGLNVGDMFTTRNLYGKAVGFYVVVANTDGYKCCAGTSPKPFNFKISEGVKGGYLTPINPAEIDEHSLGVLADIQMGVKERMAREFQIDAEKRRIMEELIESRDD